MARFALLVLLLPCGVAAQDRPVVVQAQVIRCATGADRKALPSGKLDAIAKQLVEQTGHNQYEVIGGGLVRTEEGAATRMALGSAMNLSLSFKPTLNGPTTLADLVLSEESEREVATTTSTSTVKEKRILTRTLLMTKCSVTDEEWMLVGVAGSGTEAVALVVKVMVR